jgi:hypothetical protein
MDSIKCLFPQFPHDLLEEKYTSFYNQLKFVNQVNKDLTSYQIAFPNLTPSLIKSYYVDFLVHIDAINKSLFYFNAFHTLPFNVLFHIFRYLDIFDLIRLTMTNSDIYRYILSIPFFANRIKWEREHEAWITKKLLINDFSNLVYYCSNPVEQCYKNHVVLKRNLIRIDPLNSNDKDIIDRFKNLTPFKAFNKFFHKNFGHKCSGRQFFATSSQFYKELVQNQSDQLIKYEHASVVAKRYGFIFCFRSLQWWFPDDKAINNATDLCYMVFPDEAYTKYNVDFLRPPPTITLKKKNKSNSSNNSSIKSSNKSSINLPNQSQNDKSSNKSTDSSLINTNDSNIDFNLVHNIDIDIVHKHKLNNLNNLTNLTNLTNLNIIDNYREDDIILKVDPQTTIIPDNNSDLDINTDKFLLDLTDDDIECEFTR